MPHIKQKNDSLFFAVVPDLTSVRVLEPVSREQAYGLVIVRIVKDSAFPRLGTG